MEAAKLRLLVAQRINVGVLVRNYLVHVLVEHPDFDMLKILQIIQIVVGANCVRYWPLGQDPQPQFAPLLPQPCPQGVLLALLLEISWSVDDCRSAWGCQDLSPGAESSGPVYLHQRHTVSGQKG